MDEHDETPTCTACGRALPEPPPAGAPPAPTLCPECAELDRKDQLFWSTMLTSWWP